HRINIHFPHLVSILSIHLYLDFEADGSFTSITGTGYHDLILFSELDMRQPKGWVDVRDDGKTLRAFLVQIQLANNHQNGKDARVRGFKVYTHDEGDSQVKQGEMEGEEGKQEM
ncbi:anaphase-promoting complex, subunit 10/DOC domain-containing protein, partial [Leptodontidium sp. 2 PMI_412]